MSLHQDLSYIIPCVWYSPQMWSFFALIECVPTDSVKFDQIHKIDSLKIGKSALPNLISYKLRISFSSVTSMKNCKNTEKSLSLQVV
jgi:hypothetical protein